MPRCEARNHQIEAPAEDRPGDDALVLHFLRAGALTCDQDAEFDLGEAYFHGHYDLAVDIGYASYWYGRAAEQGHTSAMRRLALLFFSTGIEELLEGGRFWIVKAMLAGDPHAADAWQEIMGFAEPAELEKAYTQAITGSFVTLH